MRNCSSSEASLDEGVHPDSAGNANTPWARSAAAARSRRTLCSVFEGWSYEEIVPPIFDYYDVFIKGMDAGSKNRCIDSSTAKATFLPCGPSSHRWLRKPQSPVSRLRPNRFACTTPAKSCASRNRKAGASGNSHKSESKISAAAKQADIEILLIAVESLQRLGISEFQINLGSVDFFGGIVDRIELPEDRIAKLKAVLNLKDQPGLEALLNRCLSKNGARTFCAQFRT